MSYTLSRNYTTDFSRTTVKAILDNMAKDLAAAKDITIPTKNVFNLPDVSDENENRFTIELLPTVSEAGIDPEDVIPGEVARNGRHYVRLHGMTDTEAHVTVRKAADNETDFYGPCDFEAYIEMWERITANTAADEDDDEDDESEADTRSMLDRIFEEDDPNDLYDLEHGDPVTIEFTDNDGVERVLHTGTMTSTQVLGMYGTKGLIWVTFDHLSDKQVRVVADGDVTVYEPDDSEHVIGTDASFRKTEDTDDDNSEPEPEPTILTDGGVDTESGSGSADDPAKASTTQAIEAAEATDREHIIEALPEDIRSRLTKRAFSPGSLRKLLIDTYYAGPIGIGRGGWIGLYGGGAPGTEMRRPHGALYNFPRSWRYAALQRALNTGIITHVGDGKFAATQRGVALLNIVDRCPEHNTTRKPMVKTSRYQASPRASVITSHRLVTVCPDCGTSGYSDKRFNSGSAYEELERSDTAVNHLTERLEGHPHARVYGLDRPIDADLSDTPSVDEDATEELLEAVVENHVAGTPAELFAAYDVDQWDREVITIPSDGAHYRFAGFDDAVAVSRKDTTGDVHFTLAENGETLIAKMSYNTATEGAKEDVKTMLGTVKKYEWDNANKQWLIEPEILPVVVGKLTKEHQHENRPDKPAFEVTVSEDAMTTVVSEVPMLGVDADGELI